MNIVHWGTGKLGLSLAVWNMHCGHDVVCVDTNPATVQAINEGRSPIDEPQVQGLLDLQAPLQGVRGAGSSIHATLAGGATNVILYTVGHADIIFIIVPTPSLKGGAFDLSYVEESCRVIGKALRQKDTYTLVVCVSTIMPGDSRRLIGVLEKVSGQACGTYWGFAYSPEFVRQGSVVHDYANPDVLLIGASDVWAANKLQEFYETVVQNAPGIFHMSLESAEIAKIGLNAAVVTKIAVANQLAWLCHRTPGADAGQVLGSIGADPRIGHRYFSAGLWPGGPCFPRDCRALAAAIDHGIERGTSLLLRAVDNFTDLQAYLLGREILCLTQPGDTIGLLGLAYKPGVSLLVESQALRLASWLEDNTELYQFMARRRDWASPNRIMAYDPDVGVDMSVQTLLDLVHQSDVIVVMTPKPQFLQLEGLNLSGKVLFDCWGYIGETNADKHIVLGVGV